MHEPSIACASRDAPPNVEWVLADLLDAPLEPASFDFVASIAALHHVDMAEGLERMKALLRPGGRLVIVGLARGDRVRDLPWEVAGGVWTRVQRLTKRYEDHGAPTVWPPPVDFRDVRRIARRHLPGHDYRRHVLWRWSVVWHKPAAARP